MDARAAQISRSACAATDAADHEALRRIAKLYVIEAEIRGKPPDERRQVRQARSRPLFDDLERWLRTTLDTLSRKSDTAASILYALKLWPALLRYCDDGAIEIDNSAAERSLGGVTIGRRNYLFAGADSGGERAAAIHSLIGTAKLNGVDPEARLHPFLFARPMAAFFESLGRKEQGVVLAYLVLPIILDGNNRQALKRARVNSNLHTFIGLGERLRSLPARVAYYRDTTDATLRYLFSLKAIEMVDDMVCVTKLEALSEDVTLDGLVHAAQVLGRFFRDHPVPAVYRMVGVMGL